VNSYIDIEDAGNISATGARLAAMAEAHRAQVAAVRGEIAAIEAERPWGNDHFGEGFEFAYLQPVNDHPPLRTAALDGMDAAGEPPTTLGDKTVRAMTTFQGGEAYNQAQIRSAGLDV
jgi:hypothetical protein